MKKIDWYIFKKLIITFIFCLLLFTIVAVAVDTSEKTDNFVQSGLSTSKIITDYFFGFVPFIWSLLFPLFVFIAVIFFTSKMATRSEIIAILASGTSYRRFHLFRINFDSITFIKDNMVQYEANIDHFGVWL